MKRLVVGMQQIVHLAKFPHLLAELLKYLGIKDAKFATSPDDVRASTIGASQVALVYQPFDLPGR
jgi:hypothetical protein